MASTTTPSPDAAPPGAALPGLPEWVDDAEAPALPEVLVVEVAGALVAMPVEATREVLRPRGATRVPGAPSWVIGLLNVRGAVVAAGDLALLAGARRSAGPVVLVELEGRRAGLRVDGVIGVHAAEIGPDGRRWHPVVRGLGLPSAGVARLSSEAAAHAASGEVSSELPLLDVRAVLDDILEGDAPL